MLNRNLFPLLIILGIAAPSVFAREANEEGLLLEIGTPHRISPGKLETGSVLEGRTHHAVYSGYQQVLPAGTAVRLVVSGVTEQRSPVSRIRRLGSLVTRAPRQKDSWTVSVSAATVTPPDGPAIPVNADVLAIIDARRVYAPRKDAKDDRSERRSHVIVRVNSGLPPARVAAAQPAKWAATEIPAGTRARVMLMRTLNASETHVQAPVEARLVEPIRINDQVVVPAGTLIEGQVTSVKGPRRLYRPANMRLRFNQLQTLDGHAVAAPAIVTAAEAENGAGAKVDSEGGIFGGPASKKRLALDLAISYVGGKIVDDLLEEGLKMAYGPAVSGTAATVARYVGIGIGVTFLVVQRGHDVRLPQYTELELTFTRTRAQ